MVAVTVQDIRDQQNWLHRLQRVNYWRTVQTRF